MEENIKNVSEKMPINDFTEKEIREKILTKINPEIKKGRSPHHKGKIRVDGIVEARVKIPNSHNRIMTERKSKYIASALKLDDDGFNDLIKCPMTGSEYYKILKEKIKK